MLEKIVQIKSIGRFRDYSTFGDLMLRKLTLVYAENGRGKTTLCSILRSLQTGQREFIMERKTLAATVPACAHLRFNNTSYQFTNDTWTATHQDILIFDPVFVNDNVYSGDYVDHEHKKNLYRVIVGTQGVQLAKQIEELDGQIRDANANLRTRKDAVSKYLPSGVAFEDYILWQPVIDIEKQIKQITEELDNRLRATAKSSEIQSKGFLGTVQTPSLPSDFATILAKQLTDVISDAEIRIRQQITQHQMESQGEPWLSQGLGYVRDDCCPFCGQNIGANDLIAAYRSYFSEAYVNLKKEVSQLKQRVISAIGISSLGAAQQTLSGNNALAEFWKQFIIMALPILPLEEIQQKYTTLFETCMTLAKRKQDSPTDPITLDAEFNTALSEVEATKTLVAAYNASIEAVNKAIAGEKAAVSSQFNIPALKNELAQLEARKKRSDPEVAEVCQAYLDSMNVKTVLEQTKAMLRQQLDQHCQDLLRVYELSINEYLDQFNVGFRITNTRHLYTGGTPSSQYQIEINGIAIDLGDTRTPSGTPCFKTALSSGDRNALALAFFLAVLKHDSDIGRKIIVFDDPFTSLDRFRRTCTQQLIQWLANSAEQVIVLSHDPQFLKLLYDEYPHAAANVKTIQMSKAGDTTIIGDWDIESEALSSYMKDYASLLAFSRERKGEPRSVARAIRPFLEGLLRSHFPGHFQQNEWLGDMIGKIRGCSTDGLQHAKAMLADLEAINGYSKKYHHQQNVNADTEPINDDELHGYVRRTLRLVGN